MEVVWYMHISSFVIRVGALRGLSICLKTEIPTYLFLRFYFLLFSFQ